MNVTPHELATVLSSLHQMGTINLMLSGCLDYKRRNFHGFLAIPLFIAQLYFI